MKVFAISDIHLDYKINQQWLAKLSKYDYQEDILILAGDISDNLQLLESCFSTLSKIFLNVLYVPGNHELWVVRNENLTSVQKFELIRRIASDHNIGMQPYSNNTLSIVPLLGWYDYTFGNPGQKLKESWMDFQACLWPESYTMSDVTDYFTHQNEHALKTENETIISFSHFLPRIDLMPERIPDAYRFLHPILGSTQIEAQIRALSSDIHVYGHSHVNRDITISGIRYVNNAFGYPRETKIARKEMLCIYEQD